MTDHAFGRAYSRADLSALRRVFERFSVTYGAAMSDDDRSVFASKLFSWMAEGCHDEDRLFRRIVSETAGSAEAAQEFDASARSAFRRAGTTAYAPALPTAKQLHVEPGPNGTAE